MAVTDDKLVKDFERHINNLKELQQWFDQLYYNERFSNMFNRPVLSLLVAAADYLISNVENLRAKYISKLEKDQETGE